MSEESKHRLISLNKEIVHYAYVLDTFNLNTKTQRMLKKWIKQCEREIYEVCKQIQEEENV